MNEEARPQTASESRRWSAEEANDWQSKQPWVVGCNFLPSTAINQLEMWQAESFDAETIDRELGWAAGIGMNSVRVYLHDLLYEADADGFLRTMDKFLSIASKHGIRPLFVFFDDCWQAESALGKQPEPKDGVHNSGWVQSPSKAKRNWPESFARLEPYVKGVLSRFKDDPRIYAWDLYNEPSGSGYAETSMTLLAKAFEWAWAVRPSQPLTVGVWADLPAYNQFQTANSDVVSFHNYEPAEKLSSQIAKLKEYGRPIICTEWMARTNGSRVETNLPVFKEEGVACFNWGLVTGKSNTKYPWSPTPTPGEPELWFHDLFQPNGQPYRSEETDLFKSLTGRP